MELLILLLTCSTSKLEACTGRVSKVRPGIKVHRCSCYIKLMDILMLIYAQLYPAWARWAWL